MAGARTPTLDRPIVLVGFMAAGKSAIGRRLAQQLGLAFVDTDALIEDRLGMPVAEIFRTRGEAQFRDAERQMILQLLDAKPQVIAVGGGAFVDPRTRARLLESARTIWLDPPFDVIAARVERSSTRPLASNKTREELQQLWQERRPAYAEAPIRIATSDRDPQLAVDAIVAALAEAKA